MISLPVVDTGDRLCVVAPTAAELDRLTRLLAIVTARGDRATALILQGRIHALRQANTTEIGRAA